MLSATVVAKLLRPTCSRPTISRSCSPARRSATNRERPAAIAEARCEATFGEPETPFANFVLRQQSAVGNDHRNRPGRTATDRTAECRRCRALGRLGGESSRESRHGRHQSADRFSPMDGARPAGQRPPAAVTVADGEPAPTDRRTRGTRRGVPTAVDRTVQQRSVERHDVAGGQRSGWLEAADLAASVLSGCANLSHGICAAIRHPPGGIHFGWLDQSVAVNPLAKSWPNAAALVEFQLCSGISP